MAVFDRRRYTAGPAATEAYAKGQELGPMQMNEIDSAVQPARGGNATMNASQPPLTQQQTSGGRGPGPYGAPLTRKEIAENGQLQKAQQDTITGLGAAAAGSKLFDVKKSPEYQNVASQLDAVRKRFAGNRAAMFEDADYQNLSKQMAGLLQPVDQARGMATTEARNTFNAQDSGYNGAKFAAGAVPLTLDQMAAERDRIASMGKLNTANAGLATAQAGKTVMEAGQIPQNAASARNVAGSEADLNRSKATNLPKQIEAEAQGNKDLAKAREEGQNSKTELARLREQQKAWQAERQRILGIMKDNGIAYVGGNDGDSDNAGGASDGDADNGGTTSTTQPSTGGSFNGSKNPLQPGAGGGNAQNTQGRTTAPEYTSQQVKELGLSGKLPKEFSSGGKRWRLTGQKDSRGVPTAELVE